MTDIKSSKLNLDDIARLSGVSRATASRVMNGHPYVSEKTRKKVMEVVRKYNYHPNSVARALASQSSHVIGIVIPELVNVVVTDPFFTLLLQAITQQANLLDYDVTLWLTSSAGERRILNRALRDHLSDGLIIAEASINPLFLEILDQRGTPYLIIGRPATDQETTNFIDAENLRGAELITQHLIERGYQRIAFIPGRESLTSSQDRFVGYSRAIEAAERRPIIAPSGDFTKEAGYQAMQYLLPQKVDAVFCASDTIAIGAMQAIRDVGLRIPDDIAVGGFDDMEMASTSIPALTTVRQPILEMGAAATQGLIQVLTDDNISLFQKVMPVELIVREST